MRFIGKQSEPSLGSWMENYALPIIYELVTHLKLAGTLLKMVVIVKRMIEKAAAD